MKTKEENNLLQFTISSTSRFVIKQFPIFKKRANMKIHNLNKRNVLLYFSVFQKISDIKNFI